MLSNAAIATLLALIALAIGYASRSPAVRHPVWLIVLLKPLSPPLFIVPLPVLSASWAPPPSEQTSAQAILLSASDNNINFSLAKTPQHPSNWWSWFWPMGIADIAIVTWVIGSIAWFVWQGRKIIRFRRRIACAEDAPPEIAASVCRIASTFGIERTPEVKIVAGIASPMLWGRGWGAIVLLPRELLSRLSTEGRDTLLAHELAHFLRRDHWVRALEFIVTGLFWWHPLVWFARRSIEAAEEECCDAWVVCKLEASPRSYAEALLETVNF